MENGDLKKAVQPVAIIGTGCRFPGGASSPSRLWDLLKEPRIVASQPPRDRFDIDSFYHESPSYPGTTNAKEAYFLDHDPRPFDAPFFNISAAEAESIDPQQRQLLETVYESLEAAGLRLDSLQGSKTGIYCGVMNNDWGELLITDPKFFPQYLATGTARSILANRVSYFFDWHGPSVVVDTACSSSMVALHQAVTALQGNECSLAVAAGTNLIMAPMIFISTTKIHMLSPTGRSRMWDAEADGYARGEGVVSVVLKRLSDAIADGDHIECVIRATATNQDGRTMGITMPSSDAQLQLIQDTYKRAGLDPRRRDDRPQVFEAHGTGTVAGDPQEASAIHRAFFGDPSPRDSVAQNGDSEIDTLLVGSIKTVVGHTEGTAGLAGIMKACLSLQNGIIPPNLLFNSLNPALEPYSSHLKLATEATPWPSLPTGAPRRVSVNSFGFGGTNAHAILESYDMRTTKQCSSPAVLPFVFSAASLNTLLAVLSSYAQYLKQNESVDPLNLALNLLHHRSALRFRLSIWATTIDELIIKIEEQIEAIRGRKSANVSARRCSGRPRILGVFTGQGAQWARMGWDIINASPRAREWLQEMDDALKTLPAKYRPPFSLVNALSSPKSDLTTATLSQPLCTALQIILVNFLKALGVELTAVVGHSSGEIAAAYAAGYLTANDAIRIAYLRGMVAPLAAKQNCPGAMLAAGLSAEEAEQLCADYGGRVTVAAVNAPFAVTLSGDADALQQVEQDLNGQKRFCRPLRVDTAYHSHHMQACASPYLQALEECGIEPLPGDIKWYSSVFDGAEIKQDDLSSLGGDYWIHNMVRPVLFSEAISTALKESDSLPDYIMEIGPHPALKGPVQHIVADLFPSASDIEYLAPCSRSVSGLESLSSVLGSLWKGTGLSHLDIKNYLSLFTTEPGTTTFIKDLPVYPFDHSKLYVSEPRMLNHHLRHRGRPHPLLGTLEPESADGEWRWRQHLRRVDLPWLDGHCIQSQTVLPATGYVALAIEAAGLLGEHPVQLIQLDDFVIHNAIAFPDEESAGIETLFRFNLSTMDEQSTSGSFHIHASTGEAFQLRASGRMTVTWGSPEPDLLAPVSKPPVGEMREVDTDEFYSFLSTVGYGYTGIFQGLRNLSRHKDVSRGEIVNVDQGEKHPLLLHPAVMDTTLQTMLAALGAPDDGEIFTLLVPTHIKSITINPALCTTATTTFQAEGTVTSLVPGDLSGDAALFTKDGNGVVQFEGVKIAPLLQPEVDRLPFSETVWGPLELQPGSYQDPPDLASHLLAMEQLSLLFLKLVDEQMTDAQRNLDWHRARFAAWIDRILALTRDGKHPILSTAWLKGTQEDLQVALKEGSHTTMGEMVNVVGNSLLPFFRGETTILEEVRKNDVLTRFYRDDLETKLMSERLGHVVGQLAFRYPRMKILEIGAGTGSATRSVLDNIGREYYSYTFTDISVGFFEEAKDAFSEHEDRFIFAPLNVEVDPTAQDFEEHSYDLVIAANVLHATSSMVDTMTHVRRLLKPGGYLVMLEITNTDAIRGTFIMGGIEGWWAGGQDGRVWGPMLSASSWDDVLRRTGFGGIDLRVGLGSPELRLYEVLVAQAADDKMTLLREPLSLEAGRGVSSDLLIIGRAVKQTSGLVGALEKTLSPYFTNVYTSATPESLSHRDLSEVTVLSLMDFDHPTFQALTEDRLHGLQRILPVTKKLLWVTLGEESNHPHIAMSKGWLRSLAYEQKDSVYQYLNIESQGEATPTLIATTLMRFVYSDGTNDFSLPDRVHSIEPELNFKNGAMQICRLRTASDMNQRYLSARRWQNTEVDLADPVSVLRVVSMGGNQYTLRTGPRQSLTNLVKDHVRLHVRLSSVSAVSVLDGFLHVVIGEDERSGAVLVALSDQHEHIIDVPAAWTVEVPPSLSSDHWSSYLMAVNDVLTATILVDKCPLNSSLYVHEAGPTLVSAIWSLAMSKNVSPFCTTSDPACTALNTIYLHPKTPKRVLQHLIPPGISAAANLHANHASDGLFSRVSDGIAGAACLLKTEDLYRSIPVIPSHSAGAIQAAVRRVCSMADRLFDPTQQVNVVVLDGLSSRLVSPHVIVDWSQTPSVQAQVEPITSVVTLSKDKTYILAGMAGDLGQSICSWMVSKGARHVVLTSRNPNVSTEWLDAMGSMGAQVIPMKMDLSDKQSVINVYRTIQQQHLPPVGGVVNGALVLEDLLFTEQTVDSMNATFAAKVQGSLHLDDLSGPDVDLDFFILFGSITGVVGNFKQSAYSTATAFQSALIQQRRARGLVGSIVHPGLINGVGYMTRQGSRWTQYVRKTTGSLLLSERDLDKLFAEAILAGRPELNNNPEFLVGLPMLNPEEHPDIAWSSNPTTWAFMDYFHRSTSKNSGPLASNSVQSLLSSASSPAEIKDIITTAVISKVRAKFSLSDDVPVTPATQLVDLGIDSLVAVDLRAWFRKDLGVDIPLLQIMGGASVEVLVGEAVGKLQLDGGSVGDGGVKMERDEVNGNAE